MTLFAKAFLKSFVRTCPVPMAVIRESDGTIVHANDLAHEFFHRSGPASSGCSLLLCLSDPQDLQRLIKKVRCEGTVARHDLRVKRSDGSSCRTMVSACRVPAKGSSLLLLVLQPPPPPRRPQDLVMDLHDNILQTLYAIGWLLLVCESSQEIPSGLRGSLAQARRGLEGACEEMGKLIAGFSEERRTSFSLKTSLLGMAVILKGQGFKGFRLHLDPLPRELLSPQKVRQLFPSPRRP